MCVGCKLFRPAPLRHVQLRIRQKPKGWTEINTYW